MITTALARFFADHDLSPRRVLVALSGGPDSTALLIALHEWDERPFDLAAAHINHHLRGEESDADEAFARIICERFAIPFLRADAPLDDEARKHRGVESAAREVRYDELHRLARESGADFIATGHQKDDQAETLLLRFTTGSGPSRLRGIAPITPDGVIRPMLDVSRSDIESFLRERNIEARADRMNEDPRFPRNRIRREILPLLRELNPQITSTLAETARQVREQEAAIDEILGEISGSWLREGDHDSEFDLAAMPENDWLRRALLLREIHRLDPDARDVSAKDLARLVRSLPKLTRTTVTKDLEIMRSGGLVILRRRVPPVPSFELPIQPGGEVSIREIDARLRLGKKPSAAAPFSDAAHRRQLFQLPLARSRGEFVIRNRRAGERFRPLGFRHEKKLNEFLIDRKIPSQLRDRLPLLTWNGQIVWIGGVEVSDDFKVTDPDREVYEVTLEFEHG